MGHFPTCFESHRRHLSQAVANQSPFGDSCLTAMLLRLMTRAVSLRRLPLLCLSIFMLALQISSLVEYLVDTHLLQTFLELILCTVSPLFLSPTPQEERAVMCQQHNAVIIPIQQYNNTKDKWRLQIIPIPLQFRCCIVQILGQIIYS